MSLAIPLQPSSVIENPWIQSKDRLSNTRRPPINPEQRKQQRIESIKKYSEPGLDDHFTQEDPVNEDTKAYRQWLMRKWKEYGILYSIKM
jgi:hypothetical protein